MKGGNVCNTSSHLTSTNNANFMNVQRLVLHGRRHNSRSVPVLPKHSQGHNWSLSVDYQVSILKRIKVRSKWIPREKQKRNRDNETTCSSAKRSLLRRSPCLFFSSTVEKTRKDEIAKPQPKDECPTTVNPLCYASLPSPLIARWIYFRAFLSSVIEFSLSYSDLSIVIKRL